MSTQGQIFEKLTVAYDEGLVVISRDGVAISLTPKQAILVIESLAKFLQSQLK